MRNASDRWDCTSCRFYIFAEEGIEITDTKTNVSVQANVISHKEKIKPGATFKRVNTIYNLNAQREGVYCRCSPAPWYTPRHSGRYPWKDDDNEIREVFNMDSNRFNRFISSINAAGGSFMMEHAVDTNPTVKIEIPYNMLYHLHIDGDGSAMFNPDGPFSHSSSRIPAISQIQTFNDRVVQVTFIDGSQTKCVCGKDETFDLYEGIAFCLFKRFLGKEKGHKHFNDLMRYAFKKLDEQEKQKERKAEIEAENKRHEEKKKLQAQRRKAKKREEKIGIYQEAMKRDREAMISEG